MMEMFQKGKQWIVELAEVYKNERRRHERLPVRFEGTLSGPFGMLECSGKDMNRDGAGVQSPGPLLVGTLVFLEIPNLGLMGFAHVRHCSARDDGFFMGLEFREGLSRERNDEGWERQRYARSTNSAWDEAEF